MERMPRVLILITLAEPGGAQTYVAHLLPALAPRCEVVVAAYGDGPLRDRQRLHEHDCRRPAMRGSGSSACVMSGAHCMRVATCWASSS